MVVSVVCNVIESITVYYDHNRGNSYKDNVCILFYTQLMLPLRVHRKGRRENIGRKRKMREKNMIEKEEKERGMKKRKILVGKEKK